MQLRLSIFQLYEKMMYEFCRELIRIRVAELKEESESYLNKTIFSFPNLSEYFVEFNLPEQDRSEFCEKVTADFVDMLNPLIRGKKLRSLMELYFLNHIQWKELTPKIDQFILQNRPENPEFLFLLLMGQNLDYFPKWTGNTITYPEMIVAAKPVEADCIKNFDYLTLLDTRDHYIHMCSIDEQYLNDQQPPDTMFIEGRQFIKKILFNHYLSQIFELQSSVITVFNTVLKIVTDNWEVLVSKFKRGVFLDEWGIVHDESWKRELRYFSNNLIVPSINIDNFVLLLNFEDEAISPLFEDLTIDNQKEAFITLGCASSYEEIQEVLLSRDRVKQNRLIEECAFNICNFCIKYQNLFSSKDYQIQSSKNSIPTSGLSVTENYTDVSSQKEGIDFEFKIKSNLEKVGYAISMTPTTGDQGVDIIATRNGKKYAIQCKSYTGQVGNAAVQEVIAGKIFYDCDHACVITNSNFTPSAYQLAAKAGVIMCANENFNPLK